MPLADNEPLHRAIVGVLLVLSLVAVWRLEGPDSDWGERLRSRFVMGVPWGTLAVALFVLSVYLFLQGGYRHWTGAVTIPFSAWSYFYPLGMLTAAFSHDGPTHLLGNLTATVVVMPVAEYAFSHFPTRRGSGSFSSWRTNPWARALLFFPAGVLFVGLMTALFSWGPIIGFSGVVFAAVGFALVRYPLAAVVALLGQDVVITLYRSIMDPRITRQATRRFVTPGWAGIAVQGHALGLFLGAVAAVLVLWRRGRFSVDRPRPLRLWLGSLLAASSLSLWAVWWIRGGDTYVLYRGIGFGFVLLSALLITGAVVASDRPLLGELTRRQAATLVLVVPLLVMSLVAVPVNMVALSDTQTTDGGVTVRDYEVVYAEDVPNRMINVVDVSLFGETTRVNTSGVIVVSERRNVWTREVPPGALASNGRASVVVGGVGWREVVTAKRRGWSAAGGGAAYHVWLRREGGPERLAFTSGPATADPVVAGFNVSVRPDGEEFVLDLTRNGSLVRSVGIPTEGDPVTANGVTFVRDDRRVLAVVGDTRVTVAQEEHYG